MWGEGVVLFHAAACWRINKVHECACMLWRGRLIVDVEIAKNESGMTTTATSLSRVSNTPRKSTADVEVLCDIGG